MSHPGAVEKFDERLSDRVRVLSDEDDQVALARRIQREFEARISRLEALEAVRQGGREPVDSS